MSSDSYINQHDVSESRNRHVRNLDEEERHHLHGVETWTPQTAVDRWIADVYSTVSSNRRCVAYVALGAVLLTNFSVSLTGLFLNPLVGAFTLLSVVPAGFVAVYIWESDPVKKRNALALSLTFVTGCVVIGFAYLVNNHALPYFDALPYLGMTLFFFLVVAPVEEGLKMLTVYLYPLGGDHLGTAIDGAVFGAFAGLGFATGENALYIVTGSFLGPGGLVETIVGRAGVAPAHVLWSAIAGYYLGLANLNREYAGVIVLKGFLIVAAFHGVYNTMVSYIPAAASQLPAAIDRTDAASTELYTLSTLALYYTAVWYTLERLVTRYRRVTREYGL